MITRRWFLSKVEIDSKQPVKSIRSRSTRFISCLTFSRDGFSIRVLGTPISSTYLGLATWQYIFVFNHKGGLLVDRFLRL